MYTHSWEERDNTLYKRPNRREAHNLCNKDTWGMEIADVDMDDDREKMGDPSCVGKAPYCPFKR